MNTLRARLFRCTAQVASLVAAGIIAVALLILGLALNPDAGLLTGLAKGRPWTAGPAHPVALGRDHRLAPSCWSPLA